MPAPVVNKETKKPRLRPKKAEKPTKQAVRPHVAELITKVVQENAPTWEELAKR